jgi:hypothetical protein
MLCLKAAWDVAIGRAYVLDMILSVVWLILWSPGGSLALVDVSITLMSAESRVTTDVVEHFAECNPFPVRCKPQTLEREGSSGTLAFDVF